MMLILYTANTNGYRHANALPTPSARPMHVALRPALLLWATALRPLPLHPLMTDSVPPVRAAAPIVSSAPKPEGSGSQLVPKVDEELLAQVSQSLPHS